MQLGVEEAELEFKEDLEDLNRDDDSRDINPKENRFPFSVVFQPFMPLTCCFPCIGHMGIADSNGIIYDFQGPYFVQSDNMMLGPATRYMRLDPNQITADVPDARSTAEAWDLCIKQGNEVYRKRIHCLLYPNCNHHVTKCLNIMKYQGSTHHNMASIMCWVFFKARFVGAAGFLKTLLPFIIICIGVVVAAIIHAVTQ